MKRRLFTLAAPVSLLICFASVFLCYRSLTVAYRLAYDRACPEEYDIVRHERSVVLSRGSFSFTFGERRYARDRFPTPNAHAADGLVYRWWTVEKPSAPWDWHRSASAGMTSQGVQFFNLRVGTES